jgi:putative glycosyltransferase (TIGR04348 family)
VPAATPAPRALVVTPAPRRSTAGNRATALRWAARLRQLGVHARIADAWRGEDVELLVALHAQKSAPSALAFRAAHPHRALVVLLAGTDVYPDFEPDAATLATLAAADLLLGLQPRVADRLPPALRAKLRVVVQSAEPVTAPRPARFRACVLAHLRPVKDPLLPFAALALLPRDLPLEVVFAGRALVPGLAAEIAAATVADPRARWLGELPRRAARRLLASSHACLVPSLGEGGANVISEAIACGTPVLASNVPGNTGLLGDDWPGLFAVGDAAALAALLRRLGEDAGFQNELATRLAALRPLVAPARERAAWAGILHELGLRRAGA